MEMFEALVNLMHINDSNKNLIITAKSEITQMFFQKDFINARVALEDLISAIHNLNSEPRKSALLKNLNDIGYDINGKYVRREDLKQGTFVNGLVEFIPKLTFTKEGPRSGDPGFRIVDEYGQDYDCFIKETHNLKVGDKGRFWITNVNWKLNKIYLEPRIETGDIILSRVKDITNRGEPFFRFLSYDGFIKLNNYDYHGTRKVNPGSCYEMEIISSDFKPTFKRLGILSAYALRRSSGKEIGTSQGIILKTG